MMRAILVALALVLASSGEAKAQDWWWQFSYNMGTPGGSTTDYIDNFSFRGIGFQGRKMMDFQNTWSLGFDVSWQVFNQENSGTTVVDEELRSAITGTAFKYINAFPLLANAHYYIGNRQRGSTLGFVGLNAGLYYIEQRTEAGLYALTSDNWHFGGAPEVGIAFPAGRTVLTGTVRYNVTAKAGGQDYQFWTFAVGIASR
jgi:hypothetical protein